MDSNWSYAEFTERLRGRFKDSEGIGVSVRNLKYWISEGLIPEPRGASRWRFFDEQDLDEALCFLKLRTDYKQGIEDIKNIRWLGSLWLHGGDQTYVFGCFFKALENTEKAGKKADDAIEAFKRHELALIHDSAYSPPFRLTTDEGLETAYLREGGRVYRLLNSITDEDGKVIYFKPAEIEKHLLDERERLKEFVILQDNPASITKKTEQIRALIDQKVMPAPFYRYKDGDYYSSSNIDCGDSWLRFMEDYGLDYAALRRLRQRFEEDIARHFLTPDQGIFLAAPEHFEFQRQVIFFNRCLSDFRYELFAREDTLEGHTREDSIKLIQEYLDGFLFLFPGEDNWSMGLKSAYLKETPVEHLSPAQLAKGLEQHRFSRTRVEEIAGTKEQELRELRELLEGEGGEDGR